MLIGLVRDSVMQCFCHSCNVPVMWTSGKYVTHYHWQQEKRKIVVAAAAAF
jgi:hypothetical protein